MKILPILLLLTISQTHADTKDNPKENLKEYDVEIIIFEDAHARYINSESWHKNTTDAEGALSYKRLTKTNSGKNTVSYSTIKPGILNREYKRINNSSEFNVLRYSAWRQTGLKDSDAFEININELKNIHKRRSENTLTGKVKVVLARYLHFYGQLEYQRKDAPNSKNKTTEDQSSDLNQGINAMPVNNIYSMKSHRRMRSKELHYIDHPLVGILIQINPVKIKQIEQPEQANAARYQNVAPTHH